MDKIINIYSQYKEKIFYLILSIYTFLQLMTITIMTSLWKFDLIFKIGRYLCYGIFALGVIDYFLCEIKTYQGNFIEKTIRYIKSHYLLIVFFLISLLTVFGSKGFGALVMFLLFVNASRYEFSKYLKYILVVNTVVMLMILFGGVLGILPDVLIYRGLTVRHSYGYIYPTECMSHFLFMVLMYFSLYKEKYTIKEFFIINIINILFYAITDSRMDFIILLMISVIVLIYHYKERIIIFFIRPWTIISLAVSCFAFSFMTALFYNGNSNIWSKLNGLLSGRLKLAQNAIKYYGIPLLGRKISWLGSGSNGIIKTVNYADYNFVDCSYIQNVLDYGIIFFSLLFVCLLMAMIIYFHRKDYAVIISVIIIFIIAIIEPRLLSIQMNPYLLLIGSVITMSNIEIKQMFKKKEKSDE